MVTNLSILDIEATVDSLPAEERALFQRIYTVTTAVGELRLPQSMQSWVQQQFGSVTAVTRQKVVRVTNKVTGEESLFSRLRASRPTEGKGEGSIDVQLANAMTHDVFSNPYENTPEDTFGRVIGKHCVTASNIAKFDGLHGVVIFNEFHPLHFSREQIIDYIDVAWQWADRARAGQAGAKYFLFFWNCLWRAGASISHGHAHVALTSGRHYAKIDRLRQAALSYQQSYGSNYFVDLFRAHHALGCAVEKEGVRIFAHLAPFKDNEVILIAQELNLSLEEMVYDVLAYFRDRLGVVCFNLSLVTPPLAETEESWQGFPVIARLVSRGDPGDHTSDVGGMEIYAASVVTSDPFQLARGLREYLNMGEADG
jgi:galactose-1-phosphate uridylyltransferase